MLKLEQIDIVESFSLIAEILEPIVYPKVGEIHKTDEVVAREKANVHYLLAKVVKLPIEIKIPIKQEFNNKEDYFKWIKEEEAKEIEVIYKVGDIIMIPRAAMSPITFPIEGYSSPKLAVISKYSIFAVIREERAHCNAPQDQV